MKTHGILMIIAWPILSGTAIYFSAFMKPVLSKKGQWFYVHEGIMLASVILTAISIAIIFIAHVGRRVSGLVDLSVSLSLTHFVIGIIVAGGQIFNMLVALFRCKPSSRFRWIYNILHGKFTGYITALLSCKTSLIPLTTRSGFLVHCQVKSISDRGLGMRLAFNIISLFSGKYCSGDLSVHSRSKSSIWTIPGCSHHRSTHVRSATPLL